MAAILWSQATFATEAPLRAVLAHYMVCCAMAGPNATVKDFQSEISTAEASGIDGFALNAGSYSLHPSNLAVVDKMFRAAEGHKNFGLIFSFDQSDAQESIELILKYASHPNIMTKGGLIVVSGWAQTPEWATQVKQGLATKGISIFLIPHMRPPTLSRVGSVLTDSYDVSAARIVLNRTPDLDGYFYFGAGARASELVRAIGGIANVVHGHRKLFMCGISPYYKGLGSNSRVFESDGFSSLRTQWIKAIESSADWIQLVTWNDWSESTYLQPFDRPIANVWHLPAWQGLLDHGGFLRASRYYVDWFKMGRRPTLESERLFYFYQLHPKNTDGVVNFTTMERGRPRLWQELTDRFHLAAFLNRPLEIAIRIGDTFHRLNLPSGDSVTFVPLAMGPVTLTFSSDDAREINTQLPLPVQSAGQTGNFNYLSGEISLERH